MRRPPIQVNLGSHRFAALWQGCCRDGVDFGLTPRHGYAARQSGGSVLYQPGIKDFGGTGGVDAVALRPGRVILLPPARPVRRTAPRFDFDRFADLDLCVDLGQAIGSRDWWLGLGLVLTLCATALVAGYRVAPLPVAARAVLTPVQYDDARADTIAPLASGATTGRTTPPTRLVEALTEIPERPQIETTARIGRGDSIGASLRRAGVGADDAAVVARLVGGAVHGVAPGTGIDLVLGRRETRTVPRPLTSLGFRAAFDLRLEVARSADGSLDLKRIPIAVDSTPLRVTGLVGSNLVRAIRAAGVPAAQAADYRQNLAYVLDLQRQVGRRDRFDVVIEHRRAATGETETGGLLYAALHPEHGDAVELLRWTYGGRAMFFRANGESAKKGLMRTPVDGAHETSGFGMRFHPILGFSRLHQGTDFGAAMGAPIMAAAAGTVTFAGWHGGHGNYVQVLHHPGLMTAYGHMSRFAVKPGAQVAQGQVIGYVGSTGLSTGPHLHYEVWVNQKPVDPTNIKFTGGTTLSGGEMGRFKGEMERMRGLKAAGAEVAELDEPKARRRG
jgi:murein DD-endopeptidase MepM/ murein hydrolase activator NlpD